MVSTVQPSSSVFLIRNILSVVSHEYKYPNGKLLQMNQLTITIKACKKTNLPSPNRVFIYTYEKLYYRNRLAVGFRLKLILRF